MRLDQALDAFAELERRASVLYYDLSWAFRSPPELHLFWRGLAMAEGDHSHMLNLAGEFVRAQGFEKGLELDAELVPKMRRRFDEHSRRVTAGPSLDAALSIALELEESELDQIFLQLLSAAPGVRPEELEYFRTEAQEHYKRLVAAIERWSEDASLKERARKLLRTTEAGRAEKVRAR